MPKYGPDYRLEWPIEIFRHEALFAAESANSQELADRGDLLLHEAMSGPQPQRDFELVGPQGRAWNGSHFSESARFLRDLALNAESLPTQRRRYWRQRNTAPESDGSVLSELLLQDEWVRLVNQFDEGGYFDLMCPSACADGASWQQRSEEMSRLISRRAEMTLIWPVEIPGGGLPVDDFYTYVEVMHDCISRPRRRRYHSYGDDWHYDDFATAPGQALYRWRVNELFARTSLDLRLAEDGDDVGLLVHAPDEARSELTHRILAETEDLSSDPVARAVMQFRGRGANRQDKTDSCRALAHELEGIRDAVKEHLLSKDEGMLFETANKFAIRHNNAGQHDDYADEYLDWMFWTYLSTIELMRTLAKRNDA